MSSFLMYTNIFDKQKLIKESKGLLSCKDKPVKEIQPNYYDDKKEWVDGTHIDDCHVHYCVYSSNILYYVSINVIQNENSEYTDGKTFKHNDKKYHTVPTGIHKFKSFDDVEMLFIYRKSEAVGNGNYTIDMIILSPRKDTMDTFISSIEKFQISNKKYINLYTLNCDNQWSYTDCIYKRPVDSIYMKDTKKRFLFDDIDEYLSTETKEFYKKHGVPYKRIYLFHGSPGVGKSSVIKILAGKYNKSLYIFNTNKELKDNQMINLFSKIKNNNFVIIEDIDTIFDDKSTSFSAFLNALDGISSDEITVFITTNHLDKLPESLTRSGRVDVCMKFDDLDEEIFTKMTRGFYEDITDDQCILMYESARNAEKNNNHKKLNICDIQNFYFKQRKVPLENVIENIKNIFDVIEIRNTNYTHFSLYC